MSEESQSSVTGKVRAFYEEMPFNYYSTTETAARRISQNPLQSYPDLDLLLQNETLGHVLEIGCGAGWAANSIALNYGHPVTAVDMTEKAIARAAEVSRLIGCANPPTFVHSDLFAFRSPDRFSLVLSIGVLHHTFNCRKAFNHVCGFVAVDGYLFVGLYHLPGRRAFLKMFHEILESDGEEAAFRRFAALNPGSQDDDHLRSWFRDQVLHPQETQHTLKEVLGWLDENGMVLVSTSINGYDEVEDRDALIDLEAAYETLSENRNRRENSFFPGFFTVLARRS